MRMFFLFCLIGPATLSFSQTRFEKGYFVNNDGSRTECLIRNEDWKNNPLRFAYRLTEDGEIRQTEIADAQEFGFTGGWRYVRATVDIDYSSDVDELTNSVEGPRSNLSLQREPEWRKNVVVFLRVVITGKANLYYWYGDNRARLFYSISNTPIHQLIYKTFLTERKDLKPTEQATVNKPFSYYQKAINLDFMGQLHEDVNCSGLSIDQLKSLTYNVDDLSRHFTAFNQCSGSAMVDYSHEGSNREKLHITLRPGVNLSSFDITSQAMFSSVSSEFPTSLSIRVGVELEYFLQTNRNRWSFFMEPTYRTYSAESKRGTLVDKIDYTSLELPLGVRYNAYVGDESKVFFNVAYVPDFPLSSQIVIQGVMTTEVSSGSNFAFGAGFSRKKVSGEVRFFTVRNLQKDFVSISNSFSNLSLIFGYRIL